MPILLDVPAAIVPVRHAADRAVSLSLSHTAPSSPEHRLSGRRIGARDVTDRLIERALRAIGETRGHFPVIY